MITTDEIDDVLAEDGPLGALFRAWRADIDSVPVFKPGVLA